MPALPSPGAVIKTNLTWSVDADTVAQTIDFWSYTGGPPTPADLTSMASQVATSAGTQFAALLNTSSQVSFCTARDLSGPMGNEVTAGAPIAGTRAGGRLAPASAVVVSHSIARHYRGGHPRTYLPLGVTTDIVAAGTWDSTFVGDVDAAWGSYVAGVFGAYGALVITQLVNVSFYGPPNRTVTSSTGRVRTVSTTRATPIVDPITGHVTRSIIGSQRRRNRDA